MLAKLENDYGVITIDSDLVAKIAGIAAMECYGIVGMASKNAKDGAVKLLKKESASKGIKITIFENKINIEFYVIVEYGTNISVIAENIISTVKYKVENFVGLEVENVDIFVEGIRVDD